MFTESGYAGTMEGKQKSVRDSEWKLIVFPHAFDRFVLHTSFFERYNIVNDPGETHNPIETHKEVALRLKHVLHDWIDSWQGRRIDTGEKQGARIDKKMLERFKSLGYLQ